MSRIGLLLASIAALAVSVVPLGAQSAAPEVTPVGPTFAAAALSPQLAAEPAAVPVMSSSNSSLTNGEKLMILGGAALITGAIIGGTSGTIVMIGGAAVGLYGLYLHLGRPHSGEPTRIGYSYTY
ncbi:MAG TPA: hypothetical protein VIC55_08260 [Gemmatimonadaceae bacterium]|jgi:hypothetical protein